MDTSKNNIKEVDNTIGDKKAVASALLFLGLESKEAQECADWYCDKLEWAPMSAVELFGMDYHYDSIEQFKFRSYFWFIIYLMDQNKDKYGVEYMLDASWNEEDERHDKKCARLKERILDAANSDEMITEDIAVMLKMDFASAKEMLNKYAGISVKKSIQLNS